MRVAIICLLLAYSNGLPCREFRDEIIKKSISFKVELGNETLDGQPILGYGISPEHEKCGHRMTCKQLQDIADRFGIVVHVNPIGFYSNLSDRYKWNLKFTSNEKCTDGFVDGFRH